MKKHFAILLVFIIMLTSSVSYAYSDIPRSHWAYEPVTFLTSAKVFTGVSNDSFAPDLLITRAQFAKILTLTYNLPMNNQTQTFADVPTYDFYYPYIEAAKAYIPSRFANDTRYFLPNSPATREEIAAALVMANSKTMILKNKNILEKTFKDHVEISPNLKLAIAFAAENNIIRGFDDKTLRPLSPVTRAEVATILYRAVITFEPPKVTEPEPDPEPDEQIILPLQIFAPEKTSNSTATVRVIANGGEEDIKSITIGTKTFNPNYATKTYEVSANVSLNKGDNYIIVSVRNSKDVVTSNMIIITRL